MTWQEPWCIFSAILLVLKLFLVLIIFFLFHIIKMISTENLIDNPCKNSSISSSREKNSPSLDIAQALLSAWQIESLHLLSSTIESTSIKEYECTITQTHTYSTLIWYEFNCQYNTWTRNVFLMSQG